MLHAALDGFGAAASRYELWRVVWLRGLGLIYAVGYLILLKQHAALFGARGLLPAPAFLDHVAQVTGSRSAGFWRLPSLFWIDVSDQTLALAALIGLLLSLVVVLGFANAPILFALWATYVSFVHVGQVFFAYGWESLLCEAGFLAIFLAPALDPRPLPARSRTPEAVVVLLRWLTFRILIGAGLIKLRGDACWTELTCLDFHFETQPNPGPLSPFFHRLPRFVLRSGVLFNHFVELVVPFAVFGPRRLRRYAGVLIVSFQLVLIASGNLSFLNWLTIVVALACFDDGDVAWLFRRAARHRAAASARASPTPARRLAIGLLVLLVSCLSLKPLLNLFSRRQAMNATFEPFGLVNTYGAFGSVSRQRLEVVLEGSSDRTFGADSNFRAYEFPCKPGDPAQRPCLVTPYHHHLDWQMWFLPLGDMQPPVWLWRLVAKLLAGDPLLRDRFRVVPFPNQPPRFVRAAVYEYRFSARSEKGVWQRRYVGDLIAPVTAEDVAAFAR